MKVASCAEVVAGLGRQFGTKIDYEHCFSAENVEWKIKFIRDNFNPSVLFCDIEEMAGIIWYYRSVFWAFLILICVARRTMDR